MGGKRVICECGLCRRCKHRATVYRIREQERLLNWQKARRRMPWPEPEVRSLVGCPLKEFR
jgi:hypothetical protein